MAPHKATLALGIILAILGFLLAVPIGLTTSPTVGLALPSGLPSISNPHIPFAPGLFLLGVVLIYLSAVIYELSPARRRGGGR